MVWLHFIFLFAIIIYAAKLGGLGCLAGDQCRYGWRPRYGGRRFYFRYPARTDAS